MPAFVNVMTGSRPILWRASKWGRIMKKIVIWLLVGAPCALHGACSEESRTYTSCNAGYYLTSGTCRACGTGMYKPLAGTDGCTACPSSGTTVSTGATAVTQCYVTGGGMRPGNIRTHPTVFTAINPAIRRDYLIGIITGVGVLPFAAAVGAAVSRRNIAVCYICVTAGG